MVKAILDTFIEIKDKNPILNNSKQIQIKENDAPSKNIYHVTNKNKLNMQLKYNETLGRGRGEGGAGVLTSGACDEGGAGRRRGWGRGG